MEKLIIEATHETPYVHLDGQTGRIEMKGRAIPMEPEEFWGKILSWVDNYLPKAHSKTLVKLDFEYFNISSSKRILFLLYKLNELNESGKEVSVEWHYRRSDEDMYEVGQDYAFMVKVPFHFVEYQESELAV